MAAVTIQSARLRAQSRSESLALALGVDRL
jgi:hypothetical protein